MLMGLLSNQSLPNVENRSEGGKRPVKLTDKALVEKIIKKTG